MLLRYKAVRPVNAIIENKTGLLIPVRDPTALSVAIKKLVQNPRLCKNMGLRGRKLAEHAFDVRSVTSQHLRIYKRLIKLAFR